MFRFVLALAALVLLGEPAGAQRKLSDPISTPPIAPGSAMVKDPMVFYLAQGQADACGPGCDEWIAAEGTIDLEALRRLRTLLTRLGERNLPIFFHSPGGFRAPAVGIGRLLRERGMTAGVSRTIATDCVGASDDTCRALKQSGEGLAAELHDVAGCSSACVLALIGAKVRQVPAAARLGVHQGKAEQPDFDGQSRAKSNAQLGRYLREMEIDDRLLDIILRVPYERVHILSRDEIANFGIDTREFQETRWMPAKPTAGPPSIRKLIVEARGASRKEFRTSMLRLTCATSQGIRVGYYRGLATDELAPGAGRSIKLTVDDHHVSFPQKASTTKIDALDTGGSFDIRVTQESFEFFKAAATRDSIHIVESDQAGSATSARITKLSTDGLAKALAQLQKTCVEPKSFDAAPAVRLPE